jgi:hypothetical protein
VIPNGQPICAHSSDEKPPGALLGHPVLAINNSPCDPVANALKLLRPLGEDFSIHAGRLLDHNPRCFKSLREPQHLRPEGFIRFLV